MSGCKKCGGELKSRTDAGGEYKICAECGLRQDGLSGLQKRFGRIF